jgi:hypothetical protein
MTFDQMATAMTRLFPDAEVHEEDGQFVIVTRVPVESKPETEQDIEEKLVYMAESLVAGSIAFDNDGQKIIYTGVYDEEY